MGRNTGKTDGQLALAEFLKQGRELKRTTKALDQALERCRQKDRRIDELELQLSANQPDPAALRRMHSEFERESGQHVIERIRELQSAIGAFFSEEIQQARRLRGMSNTQLPRPTVAKRTRGS